MTQQDRDRLVALKKAKKGLITQRQAAEEIGQSERHVRRLLKRLKGKGDVALLHGLRGRVSVSYTHLDVYKRQAQGPPRGAARDL